MADQNKDQAGQRGEMPPLIITGQYVKDLSFEAPGTPEIFTGINDNPQVEINVDVEARPIQNSMYEVAVKFSIKGDFAGKTGFLLDLTYCGVAALNLPQEQNEPALLIEVPRLLFPFARSIISDVTRDSGFPALLLQPIDFVQLYQQRMGEGGPAEAEPEEKKKAPAKKGKK